MRIGWNSTDLQGINQANDNPSSKAKNANANASEGWEAVPEDMVSISSLAARALETPAMRQNKVDALYHQVASGQYQLDPTAVAEAMLK